jgi:hypothetical protein
MNKTIMDINLLNQSIDQWKGTRKDEELDELWPLCDQYMEDDCRQCPVAKITGKPLCQATPFKDFTLHTALDHHEIDLAIRCNKCKHYADNMVNFLENTLTKIRTQMHLQKL